MRRHLVRMAMLDPTTLPILVKALDFLFGEGSKILQERRERRQVELQKKLEDSISSGMSIPEEAKHRVGITSKQDALEHQISATLWKDMEADVSHLVALLEIHTRNYHLAKTQYAQWGSALVPPIILYNLIEEEEAVDTTVKRLQALLTKAYAKPLEIPENDEM